MGSTSNISVEEQIQCLGALPLPRIVRPSRSVRVLTLILGLAALGSLVLIRKALSRQPRDFAAVIGELVWIAFVIGVCGQIYTNPRLRNLLRRGVPTLGNVLNAEKRGNATRINYSYETASGIVKQGELMAYRNRNRLKEMSSWLSTI